MRLWKLGFASILLLSGFATSAHAQRFVGSGYNPYGVNRGVYGSTPGFGNYGGPYANYGGRGYYGGAGYSYAPQTYNNLGGLAGTIRAQAGRPNGWRTGAYSGTTIRRRGR